MEALQMHYTSCRRGQSGHSGFQTRATSPGLRPDEQREIERRSVYRPPRDAAPEPGADEIARDFPKALRFYRLTSGRFALTRCCYSGRDYSGRWGNFFAHTLVLEDGRMPPLWPIDYFEWEGWQDKLEPDADTDETPAPLPLVDLGEIAPAESFSFDELREFLTEEPERRELLVQIAKAALLAGPTSRAVVIRDRPIQALYWVAAVQKLFPPSHALELTFSTYQDDPRGCAIVNATSGETDFSFDEAERRYRFFMFDFTTGQHSEVPGEAEDYPQIATRWLAEDPRKLERFCEFIRLFAHRRPDDLVDAAHLFELSEGQESALADRGRAAAISGFASRHATPEGRVQLLELIAGAGEKGAGLLEPEDHACLVRFLADAAEATGQPRHRRLAFQAWLTRLREPKSLQGGGLESMASVWSHLTERLAPYRGELAELFLATELWSALSSGLATMTPDALLFLLNVTWTCLGHTDRRDPWAAAQVEAIIDATTGAKKTDCRLVRGILEVARDDEEALAAMVLKLAHPHPKSAVDKRALRCEVGRALAGVLASLSPEVAMNVRRRLDDEESLDVLFGEWLEISDQARDPVSAFKAYQRSVLDKLEGYGQQCRSWVASSMLDRLAEKERLSLLMDWMRNAEIDHFPDDLFRRCLDLANDTLSLDIHKRNGGEMATLVAAAAARRGITLRPDRPLLRQVLQAVDRGLSQVEELRLPEVERALGDVSAGDYETFLAAYLSPALESVDNGRQHYRILTATLRPELFATYERAYFRFFKSKRRVTNSRSMRAALNFWLRFDPQDSRTQSVGGLEETAQRGLTWALARLDAGSLKRLEQSSKKLRLDERQYGRWNAIKEGIEKRKQSPLAKLKRIFKFGT